MGFPSQEYLSGLPFPSPEDIPDPGIFKGSPGDLSDPGIQPIIPALAGGLFTAGLPGNPRHFSTYSRFIGT